MSAFNSTLTQERLKELLTYDPDAGEFRWVFNVSSTGRAGNVAGSRSKVGYVLIRLDKRLYLAHRLAALYMEGEFPPKLIDHIDTDKSNNRWSNLRHATMSENMQNRLSAQKNNSVSGLLGVYWSKARKKWGAAIVVDSVKYFCGYHATKELAHQGYIDMKRKLHPFGMI